MADEEEKEERNNPFRKYHRCDLINVSLTAPRPVRSSLSPMPASPETEVSSHLRNHVDQLRRETNVKRIRTSEAIKSLIDYCEENKINDDLVTGSSSNNPYTEKNKCDII